MKRYSSFSNVYMALFFMLVACSGQIFGKDAYVVNSLDNCVSVIDTSTNLVVGIPVAV